MNARSASELATYRKQKGMTQEELAERSGITSRTIQRIESGQVIPQFHTLKVLAKCLDTEPELLQGPATPGQVMAERAPVGMLAAMHVIPLIGLFLPLSNIVLALLFWLFKKDQQAVFDEQGRRVINFQVTMTIVGALSTVTMVLFFPVGYPLLMACYGYAIVMAIYNMLQVLKNRPVKYPLSIRFLRVD